MILCIFTFYQPSLTGDDSLHNKVDLNSQCWPSYPDILYLLKISNPDPNCKNHRAVISDEFRNVHCPISSIKGPAARLIKNVQNV